jgi:hypothetical protein
MLREPVGFDLTLQASGLVVDRSEVSLHLVMAESAAETRQRFWNIL